MEKVKPEEDGVAHRRVTKSRVRVNKSRVDIKLYFSEKQSYHNSKFLL
jgi:hypothetical protein